MGIEGINIHAILRQLDIPPSAYYRHRSAGLTHEAAVEAAKSAKRRGPRNKRLAIEQESVSAVSQVLIRWRRVTLP